MTLFESELTEQIIGAAFHVFNTLGYGYQEKYYQRCLAIALEKKGVSFQRECSVPIMYEAEKVGSYRLDFLVEDKIIVELKVFPTMGKIPVAQILGYLTALQLKLALVLCFTRQGVVVRRYLNPTLPRVP